MEHSSVIPNKTLGMMSMKNYRSEAVLPSLDPCFCIYIRSAHFYIRLLILANEQKQPGN